MKYYSDKGWGLLAVLMAFFAVMAVVSLLNKVYGAFLLVLSALLYFIWMWYDTYYVIDNDQLFYKSALVKGYVDINTIVKIIKNKKLASGNRPALSTKGIIIKYNKYDEIFVSPQNIDQFIEALKAINPNIEITG